MRELPEEMRREVGGTYDYWGIKFGSADSEINKLKLVESSINWIVEKPAMAGKAESPSSIISS